MVEEFFIAALTLKKTDWSRFFLQMTRAKFPKAVKTMRMLAMWYEASGDLIKAQSILIELIDQDPTDGQSLKRLVSLRRDMNNEGEAISALNKYLEMNQEDKESWLELANIYLSKQSYSKALYCYEELLVLQPKSYLVNLRYAETLYSSAKAKDNFDELQTARKYFSHAAILKECGQPCVRALLGLVQTCTKIQAMLEGNKKLQDAKNADVLAAAKEQLRQIYADNDCARLRPVAQLFN